VLLDDVLRDSVAIPLALAAIYRAVCFYENPCRAW
jgi:hypothetical protein